MQKLRWSTSPQGATAALHAAFQVINAIGEMDEVDLNLGVLSARDDFLAVLDEHFTFEEAE